MGVLGVNNNSGVDHYYQNKTVTTKKTDSQNNTEQVHRNSIMVNGLYVNVDPTGEIARKAFLEETMRQINESICKVQSYYAKANEENMSFDNSYNHLLEKYNSNYNKLFKSPYFRSDMTEAERQMAYRQEYAMLSGKGFANLSDPYAWASSGGVPDRDKQIDDAVQAALDQRREELLKEVSGESTKEEYMSKYLEKFAQRYTSIEQSEKMGELNLQA